MTALVAIIGARARAGHQQLQGRGFAMGKSKARPGRREPPSVNQRKATEQPTKPFWRKPVVWLGTLGTGVLIGVLVNVLSSQAERVVPPPQTVSPPSSVSSSA